MQSNLAIKYEKILISDEALDRSRGPKRECNWTRRFAWGSRQTNASIRNTLLALPHFPQDREIRSERWLQAKKMGFFALPGMSLLWCLQTPRPQTTPFLNFRSKLKLTLSSLACSSNEEYESAFRLPSRYNPLHTFRLPMGGGRHYQQQYGDMYFLRLAKLKPAVEQVATEAWEGFSVRYRFWQGN